TEVEQKISLCREANARENEISKENKSRSPSPVSGSPRRRSPPRRVRAALPLPAVPSLPALPSAADTFPATRTAAGREDAVLAPSRPAQRRHTFPARTAAREDAVSVTVPGTMAAAGSVFYSWFHTHSETLILSSEYIKKKTIYTLHRHSVREKVSWSHLSLPCSLRFYHLLYVYSVQFYLFCFMCFCYLVGIPWEKNQQGFYIS
ncbi:hypothetical protein BRADI_1g02056v3, partial [Brachypodium distachyon]